MDTPEVFQIHVHDLTQFFQFVSLLVSTIGTAVICFTSYWMRKLERNTNSKMDAVIELTKSISRAKGNVEGRDDLKRELEEKEMNKLIEFLDNYDNDHQSQYANADVSKDAGYMEGVRNTLSALRTWAENQDKKNQ